MVKRGNFSFSFKFNNNKAQLTIFVILALIIIAALGAYFLIKSDIFPKQVPENMQEFYTYYLSCIETTALDGSKFMGFKGGHMVNPTFSPGSEYYPFSSELGFLGDGIPYWFYVSGNGIEKTQIPLKSEMEKQLADYVDAELMDKCDFSYFEGKGYEITLGDVSSEATIDDGQISISLDQKLDIVYGGETFTISKHNAMVDSKLGKFYNSAKRIYDYENQTLFLENYAADVLNTYAPVEGFEINCSPIIWEPNAVFDRLKLALEANIAEIKIQGDYFSIVDKSKNYFVTGENMDFGLDKEQVNLIYSKDWPSRFEVWQTKGGMMVAEPIGTQEGLEMMGFCYTPYKFVYDVYIPVMIQITSEDGSEMFQFPFAVMVDKNVARKSNFSGETETQAESICNSANSDAEIYTYDASLNPVEADITYKCFNDECYIGKTLMDNSSGNKTGDAKLVTQVPSCANGLIIATSPGFKEKKQIFSSNEESYADLVLSRESNLALEVYVDGQLTKNLAILTLSESVGGFDNVLSVSSYPGVKNLKIADGSYNFNLRVFNSGAVTIPAITKRQCFSAPADNILGYFGTLEEKCTDITLPAQKVSNILYAGGEIEWYISQSELVNARVIRVYAESVPMPTSVEQIQSGYEQIKLNNLVIEVV